MATVPNSQIARIAAGYAWRQLAPECDGFPARRLRDRLTGVLDAALLERLLETSLECVEAPQPDDAREVVEAVEERRRRDEGIYPTPREVADGMAAAADPGAGDVVLDLSAGTGALLAAAGRCDSSARLVGVERDPWLALVAAARLVGDFGGERVRIWRGDGLAADGEWSRLEGRADAVVGNPPYVGEKGRREQFRRLEERHDHLGEYFGPRIDLAYLFVHRSLDFAAPGSRLVFLTSAYWTRATGASRLRRDLRNRAEPLAFLRASGGSLFEAAPGHHSLLSVFERNPREGSDRPRPRAATVDGEEVDWADVPRALLEGDPSDRRDVVRPPESAFEAEGWSPFSSASIHEWAERRREHGTRLAEIADDRQGFVSGADRVTARRLGQLPGDPDGPEPGDPAFVWEAGELTETMKQLRGTVLRPVVRGSRLAPGTIRVEPPEQTWALYLDDELGADQEWVVEHLAPLRPALEQRREVRRGRMPWYRLHWPRDRGEQTGPKLVVPRRARRPRFALDLSASVVSSDCTYLVPPDEADRPIRCLVRLMVALNRPDVERHLQHFGKRKGDMLEFYSDPLRSIPLPVEFVDGELRWTESLLEDDPREALEQRVESLLRALWNGDVDDDGRVRVD